MDNTLQTLKRQEPATLLERSGWVISCSRKFSSNALVLMIWLVCLGLGAFTATKAATEEHSQQKFLEHLNRNLPMPEIKQQIRPTGASTWAECCQDVAAGVNIILMKMVSAALSSFCGSLLGKQISLAPVAILSWVMAARWDNTKEKLGCKDLLRTELLWALLPRLALCFFTKSRAGWNEVEALTIPIFIYCSRPPSNMPT